MFIALSAFLPFLFGMGYFAVSLASAASNADMTRGESARYIFQALVLGLLMNYAIVLIVGNLFISFGIAAVISMAGFCMLLRQGRSGPLTGLGAANWTAFLLLVLLYTMLLTVFPLVEWDARSIWLFHGKMIYWNTNGMNADAGWNNPCIRFSHVGYPKMGPILTAQFASIAGYWNEYFPKAGLIAVLAPPMIGMFSFINITRITSLFLFSMSFLMIGDWLWIGYMDGYLALYAMMAAMFLGRWTSDRDAADLVAGLTALAVTLSLKNEGGLLLASAALSMILAVVSTRRSHEFFASLSGGRTWLLVALAFIGPVSWMIVRRHWQIPPEIPASPMDIELIGRRLNQADILAVLDAFIFRAHIGKAVVMLAVSLVACKIIAKRIPSSVWFIITMFSFYSAGMFWIYMTTKSDLSWHLETSANRTMLPAFELMAAAAFLCLTAIERPSSESGRPQIDS